DYQRRFPCLFADPEGLQAVVWEEYRQRRQAGREPDPDVNERRYGVNPLRDAPADADEPRTLAVEVTPLAARPPDGPGGAPGPTAAELADRLHQLGLGSRAGDHDPA